jgi:hypothetical protein
MKKFAMTLALVSTVALGACTTNSTNFYPVENGRTAGSATQDVVRTAPVVRRSADQTFDSSLTK